MAEARPVDFHPQREGNVTDLPVREDFTACKPASRQPPARDDLFIEDVSLLYFSYNVG
jgi:hypothetical protein